MAESRPDWRLISEHHFVLESGRSEFFLEALDLKPYSLDSGGNWFLKVPFFAFKGRVTTRSDSCRGLRLVSPQVVDENSRYLVLAAFDTDASQEGRLQSPIYAQNQKIVLISSKLQFFLQSVSGEKIDLTDSNFHFTLGIILQMWR